MPLLRGHPNFFGTLYDTATLRGHPKVSYMEGFVDTQHDSRFIPRSKSRFNKQSKIDF
jgi:hypothetical protein